MPSHWRSVSSSVPPQTQHVFRPYFTTEMGAEGAALPKPPLLVACETKLRGTWTERDEEGEAVPRIKSREEMVLQSGGFLPSKLYTEVAASCCKRADTL